MRMIQITCEARLATEAIGGSDLLFFAVFHFEVESPSKKADSWSVRFQKVKILWMKRNIDAAVCGLSSGFLGEC